MQVRVWMTVSHGDGCAEAMKELAFGLGICVMSVGVFLPLQCIAFSISERKRQPVAATISAVVPLAYITAALWLAVSIPR